MPKPKTIDEYLAMLPGDQRAALEKLRRTIKSVVPRAEECISYSMPAFRLDGRVLVFFAAWSDHCSIFPGAYPIQALKDELRDYKTSKGTVRFDAAKGLPASLVRKLLKAGIEARAKAPAARRTKPSRRPAPVKENARVRKTRQ